MPSDDDHPVRTPDDPVENHSQTMEQSEITANSPSHNASISVISECAFDLNGLAEELLAWVVSHLDHVSLLRFSVVSKRCRRLCIPRLFQHIRLDVLQFDVSLGKILALKEDFRHIRHLDVGYKKIWSTAYEYIPDARRKGLDAEEGPTFGVWPLLADHSRPKPLTESQAQALLELIDQLSLTDLTWGFGQPIPISILRRISCRLHIGNFWLSSMRSPRSLGYRPLPTLSTDDLELVTSTRPYSIFRTHFWETPTNALTTGIVLQMVRMGNVKELQLDYDTSWHNIPTTRGEFQHCLQHLVPQTCPAKGTGRLLKLTVRGYDSSLADVLKYTETAALRVLHCGQQDLQFSHHDFPHLQDLSIRSTDAVLDLIQRLPLLRALELEGCTMSALERILHRCSKLRRLRCPGVLLNQDLILKLSEICPAIEDLRFDFHHSLANYRSLCALTQLRCVELLIRIPNERYRQFARRWIPSPVWHLNVVHNDEVLDISETEMVELIRSCAFDRMLARKIFCLISSSKPEGTYALEQLVLDTADMDFADRNSGTHHLERILWYIGRSYVCRWDYDGCRIAGLRVSDAHREYRLINDEDLQTSVQAYAHLLERVWPEIRHKPLQEVWHSLPLA